MTRKNIVSVRVDYEDGTCAMYVVDGVHIIRTNHETERDANGKTRKERKKWRRHDVTWCTEPEPIKPPIA